MIKVKEAKVQIGPPPLIPNPQSQAKWQLWLVFLAPSLVNFCTDCDKQCPFSQAKLGVCACVPACAIIITVELVGGSFSSPDMHIFFLSLSFPPFPQLLHFSMKLSLKLVSTIAAWLFMLCFCVCVF